MLRINLVNNFIYIVEMFNEDIFFKSWFNTASNISNLGLLMKKVSLLNRMPAFDA